MHIQYTIMIGNINVRLRTSDRGRFPGFRATVTCVQIQSDDDDEDDNSNAVN